MEAIIDTAAHVVDEEPFEKQPTVPGWAVTQLQSGNIRQMSKGVLAYECLMMAYDRYSDSFSELEQKAVSGVSEDIFGLLDGMVEEQVVTAKSELQDESDYPDEETVTTSLHLPGSVIDELPSYEAGYHIADAVAYVHASPWSSRHDRLSDVQDLVAIIRGDSVDEPSWFVQDVMDGESHKYNVDDIHAAVEGEIEIWEQSGFDLAELKRVSESITQTPEARSAALEAALDAEGDALTTEDIIQIAMDEEVYGCVRSTARDYAERVNLDTGVKIDLEATVARIADDADPNNRLNASDWKICGFPMAMTESQEEKFSGVYTDADTIIPMLSQLKQNMLTSIASEPSEIQDGYADMVAWIDERQEQAREQLAD
jgi:hypothetical protein